MADSRYQNICGLTVLPIIILRMILLTNRKLLMMMEVVKEKSISSIDSLGMLDYSNLNIYEQDALNAAFENIDSFTESRSGTQRHVKGKQQI